MSTGTTTTVVQSITLSPGEVFTLPPGATLLYASDIDNLQSDCAEIPEFETVCYQFAWQWNDTTNLDDALFTKISFANGMSFPISEEVSYSGVLVGSPELYNWIVDIFNRPEIIEASCTDADEDTQILKIKVPEGFGVPTLEVTNPTDAGDVKMYIIGTITTDCENCDTLS